MNLNGLIPLLEMFPVDVMGNISITVMEIFAIHVMEIIPITVMERNGFGFNVLIQPK